MRLLSDIKRDSEIWCSANSHNEQNASDKYTYCEEIGRFNDRLTDNALNKSLRNNTWLSVRNVFDDLFNLHQYATCQISLHLLQYEVMVGFDERLSSQQNNFWFKRTTELVKRLTLQEKKRSTVSTTLKQKILSCFFSHNNTLAFKKLKRTLINEITKPQKSVSIDYEQGLSKTLSIAKVIFPYCDLNVKSKELNLLINYFASDKTKRILNRCKCSITSMNDSIVLEDIKDDVNSYLMHERLKHYLHHTWNIIQLTTLLVSAYNAMKTPFYFIGASESTLIEHITKLVKQTIQSPQLVYQFVKNESKPS